MQAHFTAGPFEPVVGRGCGFRSSAPEFTPGDHFAFPAVYIETEARTEGEVGRGTEGIGSGQRARDGGESQGQRVGEGGDGGGMAG